MSHSFVFIFKWGRFFCDGKGVGWGDFPALWFKNFPIAPVYGLSVSPDSTQSLIWFREMFCLYACVYQGPNGLTFQNSPLSFSWYAFPARYFLGSASSGFL